MPSVIRGDDSLDSGYFSRTWKALTVQDGVAVTNSKPYPITLSVTMTDTGGSDSCHVRILVDTNPIVESSSTQGDVRHNAYVDIPPGSTYQIDLIVGVLDSAFVLD